VQELRLLISSLGWNHAAIWFLFCDSPFPFQSNGLASLGGVKGCHILQSGVSL